MRTYWRQWNTLAFYPTTTCPAGLGRNIEELETLRVFPILGDWGYGPYAAVSDIVVLVLPSGTAT
jgi:hypothetical protein